MTTARPAGQEGWTTAQEPAQIWRHIALGRRGLARGVTFKILEVIRAAGGTLTRARTICCTVARVAPPTVGGGPGG
jgi:hypothetical protein